MEYYKFNRKCDHCHLPLRARRFENRYKDFKNRNLHIQCFKNSIHDPNLNKTEIKKSPKIQDLKINFGKHKNKTYKELVLKEPKYCKWLLDLKDFKDTKLIKYIKESMIPPPYDLL